MAENKDARLLPLMLIIFNDLHRQMEVGEGACANSCTQKEGSHAAE